MIRYHLFETAIGRCGVAWGPAGVVAMQLPERDDAATRERLLRRHGDAISAEDGAEIAELVAAVQALAAGEPQDLTAFAVDMDGIPDFPRQVYAIARRVPPGGTTTYGAIAREIGDVALSREVGQALGKNPFTIIVPCHRVLSAAGLGGFSAHGGPGMKRRLLAIEGARTGEQLSLFG